MMRAFLCVLFIVLGVTNASAQQIDLNSLYKPYAENVKDDLSKPHRTQKEIGDWLTENVSNSLTLSLANMREDVNAIRPVFTTGAFRSYANFLKQTGYLPVMSNYKFDMTALTGTTPVFLDSGVYQGRYYWIYSVPVTIAFEKTPASAADIRAPRPEEINVTVRVGRYSEQDAPEGAHIKIEGWLQEDAPEILNQNLEIDTQN